ncbi:MAG TPA: class I tRNA ligase family protein, partial [Bacteroidia bacterium]|nr:class I tRNA ligase family protein [Bacteroidia bacterium]
MSEYHFREIEQKWQQRWAEQKTYRTENGGPKPKYYVLDMFPYPSGAGLHVGHPLGYIASDIVARFKKLKGFNVLHPMGYDAFGLPAEQYAIQTGQHPAITTKNNIERYREQLDKIGLGYDWDREIRTCEKDYYKWTQWIFIQLFNSWYNPATDKAENISTLIHVFETRGFKGSNDSILTGDIEIERDGFTPAQWADFGEATRESMLQHFRLAYLSEAYVNWCPAMGTVLANDEVKDGVSERGGYPVERKLMKQWSLRITAYADRLLRDLDTIEWSDSIKEAQRNWIGKSEGCSLKFKVENSTREIEVFTTRPDTIFGVSFVTLAPELELVNELATPEYKAQVDAYVHYAKNRSERERQTDVKKITGQFTGAYAL